MHTLSISFKLWVEGKYGEEVVAGTQMNNVKFIKPVYPGNTLYVIAEITNKKSIKKKWSSQCHFQHTMKMKKLYLGISNSMINNS